MTTDSSVTVEDMKEQIQKVKDSAMKIGKAMYQNTGADQSQEQSQEQAQEENKEESKEENKENKDKQ